MSWKLDPTGVPHLDHVWTPQDTEWSSAADLAATGIYSIADVLHHREAPADGINLTIKVDDAMSCKIRKLNGEVAVGYKGANSAWCYTTDHIDAVYGGKPYCNKLKVLLEHVWELFHWLGEGDVQFQVGFMAYDEGGLGFHVKPNVVEYPLSNVGSQKLAIVVVSRSNISPDGLPIDLSFDVGPARGMTKNLFLYDNRLSYNFEFLPRYSDRQRVAFENVLTLMGDVEQSYRDMTPYWDSLVGLPELRIYLNKMNREGWWIDPQDYSTFLRERAMNALEKVESQNAKAKVIDVFSEKINHLSDNLVAYQEAFNLIHRLHTAARSVCNAVPRIGEGIVISYKNCALKIVDENFTAENHARWNRG